MHQNGKNFILAFIVACIFCIATISTKAQEGINHTKLPVDTAYAHQYVGVAESLIKIGRVDSALQYVEDAAAIYMNVKEWKRCAEAYNQIGFELYRIKKFEEAYNLFNNAYSVAETKLPQPNPTLATTCNHLGLIHTIKGHYENALSSHNQALTIQKDLWGTANDALVKTYLNIGSVYYYTGDYQQSLNYTNLAFNIQKTSSNTYDAELAETYSNMGLLHLRLENYQVALENYQQSLAIKQEIYFASHPKIATTYTDLALNYQKLGLFDKAQMASDHALIILNNTFEENHPDFGVNYQLKGDIHFEQTDYKEAIDYYKRALDNRLASKTQGGPQIAETYLRIAKTYEEQKYNPMAILPYIQKGIQALVYQFENDDIFENPKLENILSNEYLLEAIQYKALMFGFLYNETGNINHLEASLSSYQLATELLLKTALQYKIDNRKPITLQLAKAIFEDGAQTSYELSKIVKSSLRDKYIHIGFQFSEQYKKYQQLLVLKSGNIKDFRGIEEEILSQEKQLKIDLDFYTEMLLAEQEKGELSNNNTIQYLQKHIAVLQKSYNDLLKKYQSQHPAYFKMKYELATLGVEDLQPYLQSFLPQTAVISYFLGDSLGYSYSITKDTSFVKEFLIDISLKNNIKNLYSVLSDYQLLKNQPDESYHQYVANAYAVYQAVLNKALVPIEDKATNLVIMRDGGLHNLPFEALLTGVDDRQTPFNELQFLVKSHTLSYAFSTSHFLQDMRKISSQNDAFLGMNRNYYLAAMQQDKNVNVAQLGNQLQNDWTNTEEFLASKANFERRKIYSDSEATKNNFLDATNNYEVVHLALLGFLDDASPLQSSLLFAPKNNQDNYDYLSIAELYSADLNFDLLIINGLILQTKEGANDGLGALQQALSYAGCLSTLASTWEVEPSTNQVLMNHFYQNLEQGMSKSDALTFAKRTFIEQQKDYTHPYFWSNYLLLGNPQTVEHPIENIYWTWWAIAGGGMLVLFFLVWIGFNFVKNKRTPSSQNILPSYKTESSILSNQASTSAITSTNVASSNGERKLANFTKLKKD